MHTMLIAPAAALAVAAVPIMPAQAQPRSGLTPMSSQQAARGDRMFHDRGDRGGSMRHDRHHDRRFDGVHVGGYGAYGGYGEWGRYNNRSFAPDSFNDWWHDQPWRSYPRWVSGTSCDRMWWGGGSWRCQW